MRRYYPGITIFKLAGCLLVLLSHTILLRYMEVAPNQQLRFLTPLLGMIVPCFYVAAGFLACKGWTHTADGRRYVRKYITRISLLYGFFCLLFAAEHIIPALMNKGFTMSNLILQFKILTAAVVLNGPFVQLWFIPPLLFGIFISYWLYEKRALRLAILLAALGFLLTLFLSGSFRMLFQAELDSLISNQDPLFGYLKLFIYRYLGFGFPFVLAGVLIAHYEEKFYHARITPLAAAALLLTAAELVFLFRYAQWNTEYKLALSILPNTILLFYGLLHIKWPSIQTRHSFINLFSVVTFCGHIPFMRLNLLLLNWEVSTMSGLQDALYVALSLVECIAVTFLLYKKGKRRSSVALHSS
ncbi:acyltransferase family protein [Paenibacillus nasutitermitis]|uniref:Acyltransferase 3 domain-containing protein n=1 Tax=Paenibacillus nasutitermitis TaxID=1652958 RepID=A0A917E0F1_9BACL|nr:acyltransferase family protein [Paenibacillus nasutitermitis]GGD90966.1 hypothetical protein GCM10010911_57080 [Paenibacillus nasutitermitis]